jgi:hypothetical protein
MLCRGVENIAQSSNVQFKFMLPCPEDGDGMFFLKSGIY